MKPLFKKGSRLDPGNYRPVSILPVLSKVLEKAVNKQLREFIESSGIMFEFQSGFRRALIRQINVLSILLIALGLRRLRGMSQVL